MTLIIYVTLAITQLPKLTVLAVTRGQLRYSGVRNWEQSRESESLNLVCGDFNGDIGNIDNGRAANPLPERVNWY